jgi:phage tail-like protein
MALDSRAYKGGGFALKIGDSEPGYCRKVDLGKLSNEIITHNLGGTLRQKKHAGKMKHDPITIEVGIGMGRKLYEWIKNSFDNKHARMDGEVLITDHDYKVMRTCEFTNAMITEITTTKFDAKSGKTPGYFTIKFQPETVRYTNGGGSIGAAKIGDKQKQWIDNNFRFDAAGLPTKHLISVDALKWTQKVTEHAVGEFIESQYEGTACEAGNLKLTLAATDYPQWYDWAKSWFFEGKKTESDERAMGISILAQDAKEEIGSISFENVGLSEFTFAALEANKDALSTFDVTMYTEAYKFDIKAYNG